MTAVGLEPTANRLKVDCSTTELRGHAFCRIQTDFLTSRATAAQRQYIMDCQDFLMATLNCEQAGACVSDISVSDVIKGRLGLFVDL